jgi:transcription antitermination factor NusG
MKEAKWFAVYTRPKWERKVTELLTKRQIKAYCPFNRDFQEWGDKRRGIINPLFNSYVFVYLTEEEHIIVRQTKGVISFVYWLGKPAIISNEEIDVIKRFLSEYTEIKLKKTFVRPNDQVKIINNPLILRKGNVLEVRNNTVEVILPSLGQVLVADARKEGIENINYGEDIKIRIQKSV